MEEPTQAIAVEPEEAIAKIENQSVMPTAKQMEKQMERDQSVREVINKYIDANMKSGKDYGSITIKGTKSKPSLLKPGAEKFCSLFKVRPAFKRDDETCEMLGNTPGIIAYICELVDGRGRVIGEGRGTTKVNIELDADFEINKAVKIAEKRAQIDAVLRTGCLSDFFTQDMEDAPKQAHIGSDNPRDHYNTAPASDKQIGLIKSLIKQKGQSDWVMPKNKDEASTQISQLFKMPTVVNQ